MPCGRWSSSAASGCWSRAAAIPRSTGRSISRRSPRHLTLLHRRQEFRAAPDSVNKMMALVGEGKIDFVLGQVTSLEGADGQVSKAIVKTNDGSNFEIACDAILPFFGLTMKLGPVADWGLKLDDDLIEVETASFETSARRAFSRSATSTPIPAS